MGKIGIMKLGESIGEEGRAELGRSALTVVKAAAFAVLTTVLLLVLSAVILLLTGVDDSASGYVVQVVRILSVCAAGLICGKTVPKMGWLAGAAAGLVYVLMTMLVGLLFYGAPELGGELLADVIIALVCGFVSGVVGINTKRKRTR